MTAARAVQPYILRIAFDPAAPNHPIIVAKIVGSWHATAEANKVILNHLIIANPDIRAKENCVPRAIIHGLWDAVVYIGSAYGDAESTGCADAGLDLAAKQVEAAVTAVDERRSGTSSLAVCSSLGPAVRCRVVDYNRLVEPVP